MGATYTIAVLLSECYLPTLKYRRLRGDMIEVFKITHNIPGIRQNSITCSSSSSNFL